MMNPTLLEVYAQLRAAELEQRMARPLLPLKPESRSGFRRRLARRLVCLGLRLDAEASRAAFGSVEPAPQTNGSDA